VVFYVGVSKGVCSVGKGVGKFFRFEILRTSFSCVTKFQGGLSGVTNLQLCWAMMMVWGWLRLPHFSSEFRKC